MEGKATILSDSLPPLRVLPRYLGYSFFAAWNQVVISNNVLHILPDDTFPLQLIHGMNSIAIVITCLILVLLTMRIKQLRKHREILYLVSFVASLATCGIPVASVGFLPTPWFIICFFAAAAAGVWITLSWFEHFISAGVLRAFIYYGLSSILGALFSFIIYLLPQQGSIALMVLLPVLSTLTLRNTTVTILDERSTTKEGAKASGNTERASEHHFIRGLSTKTPIRLIIIVGLNSFIMGVIRSFTSVGNTGGSLTGDWFSSTIITTIALTLAFIVAFVLYRHSTGAALYIAIPIIVFSSILLVVPINLPSGGLESIAFIGIGLINNLVWIYLADAVIKQHLPVVWCFGLMQGSMILCSLLGLFFVITIGSDSFIAVVVMLIVLIAVVFVIAGAKLSLAGTQAFTFTTVPTIEQQGILLAERYKLTSREKEVLLIWLTGHSSSFVEAQLNITHNTVKTHIAHIYAKTGATSKEELLVLAEKKES